MDMELARIATAVSGISLFVLAMGIAYWCQAFSLQDPPAFLYVLTEVGRIIAAMIAIALICLAGLLIGTSMEIPGAAFWLRWLLETTRDIIR